MTDMYTAFDGSKLIARGALSQVVLKAKRRLERASEAMILIFSDRTGKTMDFNLQGSEAEVLKRLEVFVEGGRAPVASGPGRPKLGVISREVSLLPRHWEWLATQSGGASAVLRKLVEDAKKKAIPGGEVKIAQERTYKFMLALAGDLDGYEEALRALYRRDKSIFLDKLRFWPKDIREHAIELARSVF